MYIYVYIYIHKNVCIYIYILYKHHIYNVIYMYIYWVLPETFCSLGDDVLVCFQLSGSLLLLLFNYFSPLLFQLIYREFSDYYFMTCITNPIKLLIWIFWQKQLTTEGHQSFVRISSSQVFDRVLNTPLRWCM